MSQLLKYLSLDKKSSPVFRDCTAWIRETTSGLLCLYLIGIMLVYLEMAIGEMIKLPTLTLFDAMNAVEVGTFMNVREHGVR